MGFAEQLINYINSCSPYAQIGMGVASGCLTSFLIMKFSKLVLAILGANILLIKIAEIEGIIRIDWDNLKEKVPVNISARPITNMSFRNADIMPANKKQIKNFMIAFVAGSLIGFGLS